MDHTIDSYVGLIALFFTLFGIWVASQLIKPKTETIIIEKQAEILQPINFTPNQNEINKLKLTKREFEVLKLVAKGNSNAEIGRDLHLSLSTIKTHVSNLLSKMDVKSRTQVVNKAQKLKIIDPDYYNIG